MYRSRDLHSGCGLHNATPNGHRDEEPDGSHSHDLTPPITRSNRPHGAATGLHVGVNGIPTQHCCNHDFFFCIRRYLPDAALLYTIPIDGSTFFMITTKTAFETYCVLHTWSHSSRTNSAERTEPVTAVTGMFFQCANSGWLQTRKQGRVGVCGGGRGRRWWRWWMLRSIFGYIHRPTKGK